jgi:heptosyltransferase III
MTSPLQDPVPLGELRRALVTKLRHHGDVLLASPVFSTLKRAAPHVEIDALVYRETAPLLANHPSIARTHVIDREWKRSGIAVQVKEEWRLLRALRERRYDLLIHLTEHPRGLTLARLLRPRYAVTRERERGGRAWQRHFTHFYRQPRLTPRHTVERNLDALRRIGIYPSGGDKRLVLVPGSADHQAVEQLLARHSLIEHRYIQVHPGSRWLFKCWPAASSATLITRLVAAGIDVVITAAPDKRERALVDEILATARTSERARVVDLSGALTLPQLAALTARARAFVGVDSAPMHIAAAMGTPVLALFGPSGEHEWGPWMVPQRVLVSTDFPCRPCGIDGCGGGKVSECLTTLSVDAAHAALLALLDEPRRNVH